MYLFNYLGMGIGGDRGNANLQHLYIRLNKLLRLHYVLLIAFSYVEHFHKDCLWEK